MSNTQITVGMIGTVPVGKNQVKVEVIAVNGEMLTVKNLNTKKPSEVKIARFTPEPAAAAPKAKPDAAKAKKAAKAAEKPASGKGEKKPGLLDNVAAILTEKGEPMTTSELIEALKAKGQLTLTGKTPKQTLYSSLFRAINKGDERFAKTDKNTFKHN